MTSKMNTDTPIQRLLSRLEQVRQTGTNEWMACCPGHADRNPSLSIKQAGHRVLINCFAGCEPRVVLSAVGLTMADLFDQPITPQAAPLAEHQRRRHNQAREALVALSHELRVLWCFAEQMHAGLNLDPSELERLKLAMDRINTARRLIL